MVMGLMLRSRPNLGRVNSHVQYSYRIHAYYTVPIPQNHPAPSASVRPFPHSFPHVRLRLSEADWPSVAGGARGGRAKKGCETVILRVDSSIHTEGGDWRLRRLARPAGVVLGVRGRGWNANATLAWTRGLGEGGPPPVSNSLSIESRSTLRRGRAPSTTFLISTAISPGFFGPGDSGVEESCAFRALSFSSLPTFMMRVFLMVVLAVT